MKSIFSLLVLISLFSFQSIAGSKLNKAERYLLEAFKEMAVSTKQSVDALNRGEISRSSFNFLQDARGSALYSGYLACSALYKKKCSRAFNRSVSIFTDTVDAGKFVMTDQQWNAFMYVVGEAAEDIDAWNDEQNGKTAHSIEWVIRPASHKK